MRSSYSAASLWEVAIKPEARELLSLYRERMLVAHAISHGGYSPHDAAPAAYTDLVTVV